MLEAQAKGSREIVLLARRNCSIAPVPMCALFAAAGVLTMLIAVGWAWFGAWLILPFAGLELAALGVALFAHARQVGDFERIHLREDQMVVEIRELNRVRRHEFNARWARLVRTDGRDCRFAVRSHGRELELGRFLDDAGRQRLLLELRRWLPMASA